MAIEYHPDKNLTIPTMTVKKFYKIYEAYETLNDDEKRKIYNETQLILIKSMKSSDSRKQLKNGTNRLEKPSSKKLRNSKKSWKQRTFFFNGFYDYCDRFLPVYLNNKKHKINEKMNSTWVLSYLFWRTFTKAEDMEPP